MEEEPVADQLQGALDGEDSREEVVKVPKSLQ